MSSLLLVILFLFVFLALAFSLPEKAMTTTVFYVALVSLLPISVTITVYHIARSAISVHTKYLKRLAKWWRLVLTIGLKSLLIALSVLYTPVLAHLMMFFRFEFVHIPAGSQAIGFQERVSPAHNGFERMEFRHQRSLDSPLYSGPDLSALISSPNFTIANCTFIGSCPIISDLCPERTEARLYNQLSLTFEDCLLILPFNIIMILMFAIGMPLFFLYLSIRTSRLLSKMNVDLLLDENMPPKLLEELQEAKRRRGGKSKNEAAVKSEVESVPVDAKRKEIVVQEIELPDVDAGKGEQLQAIDKTPNKNDRTHRVRWLFRLANSTSPMVGLIDTYKYRWIFFKQVYIVYKLFLAAIAGLLIGFPIVSLPLMGLLHLI